MVDKKIVVGIGEILWDVFPKGKKLGGAVFPVIQGVLADALGGEWRWTWTIALFCEILILLYAQIGSYPKKSVKY